MRGTMFGWLAAVAATAGLLAAQPQGRDVRPHAARRHVDGGGALARWPHGGHRPARCVVDAASRGRHRPAGARRRLRRTCPRVVARRPPARVPGVSPRHLEHLDDERRWQRPPADDVGPVRRSRTALVARRHADRLQLRSRRHLRHLAAHGRDRRRASCHERDGQRVDAGVVAGWSRGRLRVGSRTARHLRAADRIGRGTRARRRCRRALHAVVVAGREEHCVRGRGRCGHAAHGGRRERGRRRRRRLPLSPAVAVGGGVALYGRRRREAPRPRQRRAHRAICRGGRLHPRAVHAGPPQLRARGPAARARPHASGDIARRLDDRVCRARRSVARRHG